MVNNNDIQNMGDVGSVTLIPSNVDVIIPGSVPRKLPQQL